MEGSSEKDNDDNLKGNIEGAFIFQTKSLSLQINPTSNDDEEDDDHFIIKGKTRSMSFFPQKRFVPKLKPKKSQISPSPMTLNLGSNSCRGRLRNINLSNKKKNECSLSFEEESSSICDSDSNEYEYLISHVKVAPHYKKKMDIKEERREMGRIRIRVKKFFKEYEDFNPRALEKIWKKDDFYLKKKENDNLMDLKNIYRKPTIEVGQHYSILSYLKKCYKDINVDMN